MTQVAKDAARFLKSTLRLPSSTFPARAPPSDIAKYLPRCTDDLYAWQRQARSEANTFVLHDGPPYANGDLHVGHALNKILKDIICRSKLAQGKRVNYVPGWDCHGLPIELKALQYYGWKQGENINPVTLRQSAKSFAQSTVEKQMQGFRSWAVMGDWQNHWKTMDKDFELRQLEVFKAMVSHGLIFRKHKPVFWSPSSRTALAEAELEYKDDHVSNAAYIKFKLHQSDNRDPVHALIWTTTPWTLPANQAIAFNSSLQYVLVHSHKHGQLLLAGSRLQEMEKVLDEPLRMLSDSIDSKWLLAQKYESLPHLGQQNMFRPFIDANFVTAESGTGLVHCAPAHGKEDYLALQDYIQDGSVEVKAPVDDAGYFTASASPQKPALLEGQQVFTQGTDSVLRILDENSLLVRQHRYTHKYPIDWRTKQPIMIRATEQWFADVSSIKQDTLDALKDVHFTPDNGRSRLESFVESRGEWCISRQRAWGVPIPALYHRGTGEALLTPDTIEHIIGVIKDRGIDAWWSDAPDDSAWLLPGLDPDVYQRGTDTMDVWFDSGTSWTSMLPKSSATGAMADIYIEGTDQHRGWFQSSLLTNVAYQKSTGVKDVSAPYSSLITHGFTLDGRGRKMSKSEGNVISPDQIIAGLSPSVEETDTKSKKYREKHSLGPDALRLWVASSDWTKDVVVSETVVRTIHTALDKFRVTFRLMLGLLGNFDPADAVSYGRLSELDRIALLQLFDVSKEVAEHMANLDFHRAVTAVNRWVVTDLSGFYFEAIKDVCYCELDTSDRKRSALTAIHHMFSTLQDMLAPFLPLLVEESVEHTSEPYRLHSEHPLRRVCTPAPKEWDNVEIRQVMPLMFAVNSAVKAAQETARAEKLLGQSLGCDVTLLMNESASSALPSRETLMEILVVSDVTIHELQTPDSSIGKQRSLEEKATWHRSAEVRLENGNSVGVVVITNPAMSKCSRCWRYLAESSATEEMPLCDRCVEVVKEFRH